MATILQQLGDLIVIMILVGMTLYGWQQGLFLATIAGLQVLASFLGALALADWVAPQLVQADCPEQHAFAAAFLLLFIGGIVAIRVVVGAGIREGMVRFAELIDRIGGGLIGAVAGVVLAGAVLVAWSMPALPEGLRLNGSQLRLDLGSPLLRTFCRCVREPGLEGRLLGCYAAGDWNGRFPPPTPPTPPPAAPEPAAAEEPQPVEEPEAGPPEPSPAEEAAAEPVSPQP